MQKFIFSVFTAAIMAVGLPVSIILCSAAPTEASVPIRLTVLNVVEQINASVPASLPVSVVDGNITTADNAEIVNRADRGVIKIDSIEILSGAYNVGNYDHFEEQEESIALSINGVATTGTGLLDISAESFPTLDPGMHLPIKYDAKVSIKGEVSGVTAANAVFILAPVGGDSL